MAERHQNFGHSGEGLFEPDDVLKTPFSLSVSKRTEVWIVIIHGVSAGLDMHWIRRFRVNANQRPNLFKRSPSNAAVDALVFGETESSQREVV